jgi:hypothetical protein
MRHIPLFFRLFCRAIFANSLCGCGGEQFFFEPRKLLLDLDYPEYSEYQLKRLIKIIFFLD